MPDSTLSQAIREAYASAPAAIIWHTLELNHASFSTPIRVVRDRADLSARLEATAPIGASQLVTFTGFAFEVTPPAAQSSASPTCSIEIDNVDRSILAQIEAAMTSTSLITVTYRQFLQGRETTGPENDPPLTMTISAISATPLRIKATAGFDNLANRRFPARTYTLDDFPGLAP